MYCKGLRRAALALCLLLAGCARDRRTERTAVLRFENLGGDASLDWMGRAFPELLIEAFSGGAQGYAFTFQNLHGLDAALGPRPLAAPGISAERQQALAAGATRIVYGTYAVVNGALRVDAVEEDVRAPRTVRSATATAAAGDLFAAARALAGRLSAAAQPFGTANPASLRAYVAGLEAPDPESRASALKQSVAEDPDFGQASLALGEALAAKGDRPGAAAVFEAALARGRTVRPIARAHLQFDFAALRGDGPASREALASLTKIYPADPGPWRSLSEAAIQERQFDRAAQYLEQLANLYPDDGQAWNLLGYARMYGGHFDGAVKALETYAKARPGDANAFDSLGDANFYFGRFADAEKAYLEVLRRDRAFLENAALFKAAEARLMTGDLAGADGLFERYITARREARDPLVELRRADWRWQTGRRDAAISGLTAFATAQEVGTQRDGAARAWALVALWKVQLRDIAGARDAAAKAAALPSPSSAGMVAVAQFLAQPPAPAAEWAARANRQFPAGTSPALKDLTVGCALLLGRDFQPAVPLLKQAYARWAPTSDPAAVPVLLAWALAESGNAGEAAPLVEHNPLPRPAVLDPFTYMYFPRLFQVRGLVAEKQGRQQEAQRNYGLFRQLSSASST